MASLNLVHTSDPTEPYPLTGPRLVEAINCAGYALSRTDERGCFIVSTEDAEIIVCLREGGDHLSIRAELPLGPLEKEAEYVVFAAADFWNREYPFPTVYLRRRDPTRPRLVADYVLPVGAGISDAQLCEFVDEAFEQVQNAYRYLQEITAHPAFQAVADD